MITNFDFLKNTDDNLYKIIIDAEKLYKDEYFEQSIIQTRKFAEIVCKNILQSAQSEEKTFAEMITELKAKSCGTEEEKEFIEDLYFIKKQGNVSVHTAAVKQDAITALECLKRAFEIAINYAVFYKNSGRKFLNLHYDIDLLLREKINKNLFQKYKKTKKNYDTNNKKNTGIFNPKNQINYSKQTEQYKKILKISLFWFSVLISSIISVFILIFFSFSK